MGLCISSTRSCRGQSNAQQPTFFSNASFKPSQLTIDPSETAYVKNIWDEYSKQKCLGEGAFAKVFAATKRDNSRQYAIKQIPQKHAEHFEREVSILDELDHPNIIKLARTWKDDNNFYIVQKQATGGHLMDRVKRENFLSEKFAAQIIRDVVDAMSAAHSQGIVHQDLKPENIVFDSQQCDSPIVVVDWGEARYVSDQAEIDSASGTRHYMSPESQRIRLGWEVKKSDMWSIGVLTYVLLTGKHPFDGPNEDAIKFRTRTRPLQFPPEVPLSKAARKFIRKCLLKNPATRCSAKEALKMAWLLQASKQSDENILSLSGSRESLDMLTDANGLQKMLLSVAVQQMSPEEKAEVKLIFKTIDKDGNGRIDIDEMTQHFCDVMEKNISKEEAQRRAASLLQAVSSKSKGEITLAEFARAHVAHLIFTKDGMSQIFHSLTEAGALTMDEFETNFVRHFHRQPSNDESVQIRQEFDDVFGDVSVTEDEFVHRLRLKSARVDQDEMVERLFSEDGIQVSDSDIGEDSNTSGSL